MWSESILRFQSLIKMLSKLILVFALLSVSMLELEAASSCAPSCVGKQAGDHVSVPWDCTMYATCGNSGDGLYPSDPIKCADGFYFNVNDPLGPKCDAILLADPGYCVNECSPCEAYWSYLGDTTPNPQDCSSFYVCLADHVLLEQPCSQAGAPYYDYVTGQCQSLQSHCFGFCDLCYPYCLATGRIPDPQDCTSYYECDPPTVTHFQCLGSEVFDPVTKTCSSTAPCTECPQ